MEGQIHYSEYSEGEPEMEMSDLISERAGLTLKTRAAAVEREILRGKNRVVVEDAFGGMVLGRQEWLVPKFRDAPVKRLRIALARLRFRRREVGA